MGLSAMNFQEISVFLSENKGVVWPAIFAVAFVLSAILKLVLKAVSVRLRRTARKTAAAWDDIGLDLVDGLRGWVLFLWLFTALSKSVERPEAADRLLTFLVVVASTYQISLWGLHLILNWKTRYLEPRVEKDPSSSAAVGLVYTILQGVFLTILTLIALSNLGINVSALVAGLGVGGIAVALAAQNVLGDLLASLSIVLDKPFVVGDFIITGNELGSVEHIGIKTTRLRSLSGEQLILSNKDLLESRVRNYKRMAERRVVQKFSVPFSTSPEKLERISEWVKEFIVRREKIRFDRCHFAGCGSAAFDFEFVFYVLSPDYNVYMDLQQQLLLDIVRRFRAEGIEFAVPARAVFLGGKAAAESELPAPSV